MLVYEKLIKKDITVLESLEGESTTSPRPVPFYCIPKTIIPVIYDSVTKDNYKFMMERHIYNVDFFKFVVSLFQNFQIAPVLN